MSHRARHHRGSGSAIGVLIAAACLAGCSSSPPVIDLSCDIVQTDPSLYQNRIEHRPGALDPALAERNLGRLIVRGFWQADSSSIEQGLRVRLRDGTGPQKTHHGDSVVVAESTAGLHHLMVRCPRCAELDTTIAISGGRVDTVDAYLSRARTNCDTGSMHAGDSARAP